MSSARMVRRYGVVVVAVSSVVPMVVFRVAGPLTPTRLPGSPTDDATKCRRPLNVGGRTNGAERAIAA
ncbi:hypothetical protein AWC22_09425 [Mycobacterium riyadhense]|uniref:Uncharacterized protein n=1 Tax=Mycobacterium riyadhense TaxID=486698 RepID=A0A1X2DGC7_9MYCO|nr:hypothetical protein AWC22_09425 [Mycobacterium riyadhense]